MSAVLQVVRECRELLEQIIDADEALGVAMDRMDELMLEKALAMCREFDYTGPPALKAIKMLKGLRKAKAALEKALTPPLNPVLVRKACLACEKVGYIQSHTRYSECVEMVDKLERCHALLEAAVNSWDQAKLEHAIAEAEKPQYMGGPYNCRLADQCKDALKRVIFINGECALAIKHGIEGQVRSVVREADELNIRTDPLNKLRRLVSGDYDNFLAFQYKRAKQLRHHARAVRTMVKRADLMLRAKGEQLSVKRFEGLKTNAAWIKEKVKGGFMGSIGGVQLLKFQTEPLHAPLTTAASGGVKPGVIASVHAKMFAKKFARNFETVQHYMGQV